MATTKTQVEAGVGTKLTEAEKEANLLRAFGRRFWSHSSGDNSPEAMLARMRAVAEELERQRKSSVDIVVSGAGGIGACSHALKLSVALPGGAQEKFLEQGVLRKDDETDQMYVELPLTEHAHHQVAETSGIPWKYYEKVRSEAGPELWAANVNQWLPSREKRLVRMVDNHVRALLSSSYKVVDNLDLLLLAAKETKDAGGVPFRCDLSETRLYFVGMVPGVEEEVRPGDSCCPGFILRNSETGAGAVSVEPYVVRKACMNGAITGEALRKVHLGEELGLGEILSPETRAHVHAALYGSVRDVIRSVLVADSFREAIKKLREAAGFDLGKEPVRTVELAAETYFLTDKERESIMQEYLGGKDFTAWGLANAFTAAAKDLDADRSTDFERIGGTLMTDKKKMEALVVA